MDTTIFERKKDVQYEGQLLVTVDELAKMMDLAPSRIRTILTEEESPKPVHIGEHVFQGRIKNLYDQKAVLLYFLATKKQVLKKYIYKKRFLDQGLLDESDFHM